MLDDLPLVIAVVIGVILLVALIRGFVLVGRSLFWGDEAIDNIGDDTQRRPPRLNPGESDGGHELDDEQFDDEPTNSEHLSS